MRPTPTPGPMPSRENPPARLRTLRPSSAASSSPLSSTMLKLPIESGGRPCCASSVLRSTAHTALLIGPFARCGAMVTGRSGQRKREQRVGADSEGLCPEPPLIPGAGTCSARLSCRRMAFRPVAATPPRSTDALPQLNARESPIGTAALPAPRSRRERRTNEQRRSSLAWCSRPGTYGPDGGRSEPCAGRHSACQPRIRPALPGRTVSRPSGPRPGCRGAQRAILAKLLPPLHTWPCCSPLETGELIPRIGRQTASAYVLKVTTGDLYARECRNARRPDWLRR
jgi:hypothetical protein